MMKDVIACNTTAIDDRIFYNFRLTTYGRHPGQKAEKVEMPHIDKHKKSRANVMTLLSHIRLQLKFLTGYFPSYHY